MESQCQNSEFRKNPENVHIYIYSKEADNHKYKIQLQVVVSALCQSSHQMLCVFIYLSKQ